MTNQAQITFPYSTTDVRVIMIDDAPWFYATDVCKVLELTNSPKSMQRLDDDEKTTITNSDSQAGQGAQSYTAINESGLYSLILTSRKPEAKKFKKWATNEVLPTIRKTGRYEMPKPQDRTEEHITRTQLDQINNLVHEIMICCLLSKLPVRQ